MHSDTGFSGFFTSFDKALQDELGCPINTSPLTQYNGALGAALLAWQAASRRQSNS